MCLQWGHIFFLYTLLSFENANLVIGNLVDVVYKKEGRENVALKITGNSTYVNALGNWTSPIPGQSGVEGVSLAIGGKASSINMHTLVYKQWGLTDVNNQLLLTGESIGNGVSIQFVDTATISQTAGGQWVMNIVGKDVSYTKEQP